MDFYLFLLMDITFFIFLIINNYFPRHRKSIKLITCKKTH